MSNLVRRNNSTALHQKEEIPTIVINVGKDIPEITKFQTAIMFWFPYEPLLDAMAGVMGLILSCFILGAFSTVINPAILLVSLPILSIVCWRVWLHRERASLRNVYSSDYLKEVRIKSGLF